MEDRSEIAVYRITDGTYSDSVLLFSVGIHPALDCTGVAVGSLVDPAYQLTAA